MLPIAFKKQARAPSVTCQPLAHKARRARLAGAGNPFDKDQSGINYYLLHYRQTITSSADKPLPIRCGFYDSCTPGRRTNSQMTAAARTANPVLMAVQVISSVVVVYVCPKINALEEMLTCMK